MDTPDMTFEMRNFVSTGTFQHHANNVGKHAFTPLVFADKKQGGGGNTGQKVTFPTRLRCNKSVGHMLSDFLHMKVAVAVLKMSCVLYQ